MGMGEYVASLTSVVVRMRGVLLLVTVAARLLAVVVRVRYRDHGHRRRRRIPNRDGVGATRRAGALARYYYRGARVLPPAGAAVRVVVIACPVVPFDMKWKINTYYKYKLRIHFLFSF